jgi:hypothetical protein
MMMPTRRHEFAIIIRPVTTRLSRLATRDFQLFSLDQ